MVLYEIKILIKNINTSQLVGNNMMYKIMWTPTSMIGSVVSEEHGEDPGILVTAHCKSLHLRNINLGSVCQIYFIQLISDPNKCKEILKEACVPHDILL